MQIIAEKKFANVVDMVCLVPYTLGMNNERETMNTNYDWKNVSDEYLDEIIAIQMKTAKRFVARNQQAKFQRAMSNVDAAQAERRNRTEKAIALIRSKTNKEG